MSAVAILLSYGGTRKAIKTISHGRNVFRTLGRLQDRFLLIVQRKEAEATYSQHAIVHRFYYDQLSSRQ